MQVAHPIVPDPSPPPPPPPLSEPSGKLCRLGVGWGERPEEAAPTRARTTPARRRGPGRRQLKRDSSPADVGSAEAPPAAA